MNEGGRGEKGFDDTIEEDKLDLIVLVNEGEGDGVRDYYVWDAYYDLFGLYIESRLFLFLDEDLELFFGERNEVNNPFELCNESWDCEALPYSFPSLILISNLQSYSSPNKSIFEFYYEFLLIPVVVLNILDLEFGLEILSDEFNTLLDFL